MAFPNTNRGNDGKFAKVDPIEEQGRRPDDATPPSNPNPEEGIGVGGTAIYSGYIEERESNADLRGVRKYRTYSDCLANVAIVAAGVRAFLNFVGDAEWRAEPADAENEQAVELAKDVEVMLHDMDTPLHRAVRRLAVFKFYGFAVSEWIAKRRDDGTIAMKDLQARPQVTIERWALAADGTVEGVVQRSPQTSRDIPIPREKLVYVVDDALNDSPEGLGLFRHITDTCKRLRRFQQLEGFGYESDLRGIPVGRAPIAELDDMVRKKKLTKAKAEEMLEGLNSFIRNHIKNPNLGVLLDSTPYKQSGENRTPSNTPMWGIELLDGGSYSLAEVAEAIMRMNREIARILGVEHMLLGENSAGTRSLSSDKVAAFAQLVDSALKEVRIQMEKDWLGPIWELNGWDPELKPTLKVESQSFRDPMEIAEVFRALAAAGVQVDRQDEAVQELMDLMGVSRLKPLEDVDADLVLSASEAQENAMAIMEGRQMNQQGGADQERGGAPAQESSGDERDDAEDEQ